MSTNKCDGCGRDYYVDGYGHPRVCIECQTARVLPFLRCRCYPQSVGDLLRCAVGEHDDENVDDAPYDDEKDHTRCASCKGSGKYVGLNTVEDCPDCDGSGWV